MSNTQHPWPQGQPTFSQSEQTFAYGQPMGTPDHGPMGSQPRPMTPAEATAYAKAAKAHAKSLRPWFKKKRFVVPIASVALVVATSTAGRGADSTTASPAPSISAPAEPTGSETAEAKATEPSEPKPTKEAPKIGTRVKSGDFKITITKVRSGVKSVGGKYFGEKAQGQYVLVSLKATNVGDEAKYIAGNDVKLIDKKGREFSVDSMASIHVSNNNPLLEEINPGNTSKGTLAFDVPKGVTPVKAEISAGGLFGGSVTVDLRN